MVKSAPGTSVRYTRLVIDVPSELGPRGALLPVPWAIAEPIGRVNDGAVTPLGRPTWSVATPVDALPDVIAGKRKDSVYPPPLSVTVVGEGPIGTVVGAALGVTTGGVDPPPPPPPQPAITTNATTKKYGRRERRTGDRPFKTRLPHYKCDDVEIRSRLAAVKFTINREVMAQIVLATAGNIEAFGSITLRE